MQEAQESSLPKDSWSFELGNVRHPHNTTGPEMAARSAPLLDIVAGGQTPHPSGLH